jgi:mRNA-degrading endonuclease RelE of RelBE toxin-antitoxin system
MNSSPKATQTMSRNPPHKWLLNIQPDTKQTFNTLSSSNKQGVYRRLKELLNADDPYSLRFVEMLKAKKFERVRKFRVGDYRVFFSIEPIEVTHLKHTYKGTLFLIAIRDRKEAY